MKKSFITLGPEMVYCTSRDHRLEIPNRDLFQLTKIHFTLVYGDALKKCIYSGSSLFCQNTHLGVSSLQKVNSFHMGKVTIKQAYPAFLPEKQVLLYTKILGLVASKHVFGVSEKVRFEPVCSATDTS